MDEIRDGKMGGGVDLQKKTTRVNLWIIIGVIAFFVLMTVIVYRYWRDPTTATEDVAPATSP